MMFRFTRPALCASVLALAAACSSSTSVEDARPVCPRTVAVSVGSGLEPEISWEPSCGVSAVVVSTIPNTPSDPGTLMWSAYVDETSPFGPGIRYGHAPARARTQAPLPLQAGTRYRASVSQTIGYDVLTSSGMAEFTP